MTNLLAGVWGERGLRGLSALMAAFCGFATLLTALIMIGLFASTAIGASAGKPLNWSLSSHGVSTHGNFEVGATTTCPTLPNGVCNEAISSPRVEIFAPLIVGMGGALLPLAALVYGLSQACLCFLGMARGYFLHPRTAARLTRFAVGGLVFVLGTPFSGVIGRLFAGQTHRIIDLITGDKSFAFFSSFGTAYSGVTGVLTAIYAVTLTVIAVVMVKASTIADDHAQIV